MKKPMLLLTTTLGALCLALGWLAMMSGGGTVEHVVMMGHALTISGAIILAGVLISFAITVKK